jgi:hypothetical protein
LQIGGGTDAIRAVPADDGGEGGGDDVDAVHERPRGRGLRVVPEMWASLAISAMWVAVFVTAIWGPTAQFNSNDGSSASIPVAVFVTVFAFLGTWMVAKYGFRKHDDD